MGNQEHCFPCMICFKIRNGPLIDGPPGLRKKPQTAQPASSLPLPSLPFASLSYPILSCPFLLETRRPNKLVFPFNDKSHLLHSLQSLQSRRDNRQINSLCRSGQKHPIKSPGKESGQALHFGSIRCAQNTGPALVLLRDYLPRGDNDAIVAQ